MVNLVPEMHYTNPSVSWNPGGFLLRFVIPLSPGNADEGSRLLPRSGCTAPVIGSLMSLGTLCSDR